MTMIAYAFLQHRRLAKARRGKKKRRATASTKSASGASRHRQSLGSTAASAMSVTAEDALAQESCVNKSAKVVLGSIDLLTRLRGTLAFWVASQSEVIATNNGSRRPSRRPQQARRTSTLRSNSLPGRPCAKNPCRGCNAQKAICGPNVAFLGPSLQNLRILLHAESNLLVFHSFIAPVIAET